MLSLCLRFDARRRRRRFLRVGGARGHQKNKRKPGRRRNPAEARKTGHGIPSQRVLGNTINVETAETLCWKTLGELCVGLGHVR